MSDFNTFKLGDVAFISAGGDKPKIFSDVITEKCNIPVFANGETNNGLQGFTDKAKILEPAVTVSARGTIGFAVLRKEPFFPIVRLLTLLPKKEILDIGFLFYFLKLYRQNGIGSSQAQLIAPEIANRNILLPELPTQQKIASVLSALDDKIELNNCINAELEAMAKTLYDYWFVQFDFPIVTSSGVEKPYKTSGGKMVYNETLKREIPEGWEASNLEKIAKLIRGVSYNKGDIEEKLKSDNIRILRATNITGNQLDLENPIIVSKKFVNEEQILNKFDILMTMSSGSIDHIGKNAFYYFEEKVSFGAFCAKLKANENFRYFLYLFMQSPFVNATIKNECLGTNINNLNGTMVNSFKTIIPDKNILEKFNQLVEPLFDKIGNNLKQNQELSALRDWLLPMLMNGQVKVG